MRRRIYILRKGELLPVIFELPTSSLYSFSNYITNLFQKGLPSKNVVTKFALKKVQNANGITYSQAIFSKESEFTPEELPAVNNFASQIEAFARNYNNIIDDPNMPESGDAEYFENKVPPAPKQAAVMEELSTDDDLPF